MAKAFFCSGGNTTLIDGIGAHVDAVTEAVEAIAIDQNTTVEALAQANIILERIRMGAVLTELIQDVDSE